MTLVKSSTLLSEGSNPMETLSLPKGMKLTLEVFRLLLNNNWFKSRSYTALVTDFSMWLTIAL